MGDSTDDGRQTKTFWDSSSLLMLIRSITEVMVFAGEVAYELFSFVMLVGNNKSTFSLNVSLRSWRLLGSGIESAALAPSLLFIWPDHQVIRPAPQPLRYWKFTFQCIANTKYASWLFHRLPPASKNRSEPDLWRQLLTIPQCFKDEGIEQECYSQTKQYLIN